MAGLLHLVVVTLRPDAESAAVEHATALAAGLAEADDVERVLVGRSERQLVAASWLRGRDALEPFAASIPHMQFVMRGLAPVAERMWAAAAEVDAPPPDQPPDALWAFGLHHRDGVFEWQVRRLIEEIDALPGVAVAGPTVEERDRMRAAGVVCLAAADLTLFEREVAARRAGWADAAGPIEEALVRVTP